MNLVAQTRFLFSTEGAFQNLKIFKKFYKLATVDKNPSPAHPSHKFTVKLDGKSIKTPNMHIFGVPTEQLAFLVCNEFNSQQDHIMNSLMPMTALCRTSVDVDFNEQLRGYLAESILTFLPTDSTLFCPEFAESYRTKYMQGPLEGIVKFCNRYDCKMEPSYDISEPKVKISNKFQEYVETLDSWQLVGLETMTVWLKSTISATLIANEEIPVQKGINNARLEEQFQVERFGQVE